MGLMKELKLKRVRNGSHSRRLSGKSESRKTEHRAQKWAAWSGRTRAERLKTSMGETQALSNRRTKPDTPREAH